MPHVQPTALPDLLATLHHAARLLLAEVDSRSLYPETVCHLERHIHQLFAWAADTFFATFLVQLLEHTDFEQRVIAAKRASCPHPWRVRERRQVTLTLLAGHLVTLDVRAGRPKRFRRGRPRRSGKRGKGTGHQATPVLEVLGFVHRRSAALGLEILTAAAGCESHDRAREQVSRRGPQLCKSSWLRDVDVMSSMAQQALDAWLDEPTLAGPLAGVTAAERRVVLGFDGGRLRERRDRRGRKKANGYRGFDTPWVEPRQLVVHALDAQGKLDAEFGKVAFASLEGPEALFAEMIKYFKALELDQATQVIVAADGQHWQWERMRQALIEAGVARERITEVLDLGHALGRLSEISHLPRKWGQGARVRWYLKGKALLKEGKIEQVEQMCLELAKGRRAKAVKSLTNYFSEHRERMRYDDFAATGVPKGSGAVESMIRQVINLRLKGCGKFWKRERAERMLMLRCWFVTGRLESLWKWALRHRVGWWYDAIEQESCGVQADAA